MTATTTTITTAIMVTMTHDTYDSDNYDYDNGGYSNDSDRFYSRYSWSFAVFDSTSSEGVHGGHLHISEVLGITTSTKNELLQPTSPLSLLGPTASTSSYWCSSETYLPSWFSPSTSSSRSIYGISIGGILGQ